MCMALTKSLKFEWSCLQRVVSDCAEAFGPLRDTINQMFLPVVLEGTMSEQEIQDLIFPSSSKGGFGN